MHEAAAMTHQEEAELQNLNGHRLRFDEGVESGTINTPDTFECVNCDGQDFTKKRFRDIRCPYPLGLLDGENEPGRDQRLRNVQRTGAAGLPVEYRAAFLEKIGNFFADNSQPIGRPYMFE